jgi:hypothetical protein
MNLSDEVPMQLVMIKLSNPSTTDINYTISIAEGLKNYTYWNCSAGMDYWCEGMFYIVPANTPRSNTTQISFLFEKKTNDTASFNSSIIVKAQPVSNETGMVGIVPQVSITVHLNQLSNQTIPSTTTSTTSTSITVPETTTTQSSSSGGSSGGGAVATTTTLTTIILPPYRPTSTSTATTLKPPELPEIYKKNYTSSKEEKTSFVIPEIYIYLLVICAVVCAVGFFLYMKFFYF